MELSGKVEGSLKDLLPLLGKVWDWSAAHYLELMGFALLLALLAAWKRRRGQ